MPEREGEVLGSSKLRATAPCPAQPLLGNPGAKKTDRRDSWDRESSEQRPVRNEKRPYLRSSGAGRGALGMGAPAFRGASTLKAAGVFGRSLSLGEMVELNRVNESKSRDLAEWK
jgi:hypothetical protein